MSYPKILRTAYYLTTKNPIFWLFGLVLYGGFNLYAINFFALMGKNGIRPWFANFHIVFRNPVLGFVFLLLAAGLMFIVVNVIKIIFIVQIHNEIHWVEDSECDLCIKIKNQNLSYLEWLKNIIFTSGTAVIVTLGIVLSVSSIVYGYGQDSIPAVIINVALILILTSAVGVWNLLTSFFVVLHGMSFGKASKAALDLLVLQLRKIVEFAFIISVIYGLAVFIGNAFIYVWQHGINGAEAPMFRLTSLLIFMTWFAVNNVFFNVAILMFFDSLVKSIGAHKEATNGQLHPNILH